MVEWYVLYTKPHAERQVTHVLKARGIETYLPALPVARPRNGRSNFRAFFPCYVFAHCDLQVIGVSQIIYTPGLRRLVELCGHPATLTDAEIEHMRRRLTELLTWDANGRPLRPGDPVEILDEDFSGFDAIFDRHLTPEGRVRILLRILEERNVERCVPIELNLASVRRKVG